MSKRASQFKRIAKDYYPTIDDRAVLASEDEDCLTVEKVFYDTKDNTYWIPFCKEQYFPKWYCYLPSPPKTK